MMEKASQSDLSEDNLLLEEGSSLGDCVDEPTENDVLCGRGGSINSHPGNERFRNLVERRKRVYLTARFKREKRLIASSIVSEIRGLSPPGRFLTKDPKTNQWRDIGDEKARDKTSQALRENAPSIRAEIETEIKVQRAEMQQREEEKAVASRTGPTAPPPGGPHPPPPQYGGGWGYYFYGPAPPHHHHPPPPPGAHPHPPPPGYHWGPPPAGPYAHPPPQGPYTAATGGTGVIRSPYLPHPYHPHPPPHPVHSTSHHSSSSSNSSSPKSALQQTADLMTTGAESIKSWTAGFTGGSASNNKKAGSRSSSSSGSHHNNNTNDDHQMYHDSTISRSGSTASGQTKPIMYEHNKRHRIVKFRDDSKGGRDGRRRSQQQHAAQYYGGDNSLVDGLADDAGDDDIEPENIESAVGNSSLMAQISNQILNSIGSWDASTVICGNDHSDDRVFFPGVGGRRDDESEEQVAEEDMGVEWEGQEVLLMDQNVGERGREDSPERMPPPVPRNRNAAQATDMSSIGFSSLGSCHSWLPESFAGGGGSISSMFSGSRGANGAGGGLSPAASMDMEFSAGGGTENFSTGGSIGGGSLTRVFENQPLEDDDDNDPNNGMAPSPANANLRGAGGLQQTPSWERSMRSKSPLSLGSLDNDDVSLMSKASSKLSDAGFGPPNNNNNGNNGAEGDDDMVWTRE